MRSKAPDPFELPTNWISKGVGMISVGLNVRSSRFVLACIVSILASAGVQAAETMLNFEDLPESSHPNWDHLRWFNLGKWSPRQWEQYGMGRRRRLRPLWCEIRR